MTTSMTNTNQQYVADAIAVLAPSANGEPQKAERLDIVVEGEPQVQERARMSHLGHTHMYDPSSRLKNRFRIAVVKSLQGLTFLQYPLFHVRHLKVTVAFYVSNMTKDVDNLLKFVLDALQMVVYTDDRCVYQIEASKWHSPDHGYTKISVEVLNNVHVIVIE
jgi:Holliday junction resolvase RusA-like endonuclease